jgi:K(+)-stimulated pyrophosphate-energized sodium pump
MAFTDFGLFAQIALYAVLTVSILALLYAFFLSRQVFREKTGTSKAEEVAEAIKEGAQAYLRRQFKTILYLVFILAIAIFASAYFAKQGIPISIARGVAFLVGAFFSAMVGYLGMNMAIAGNRRVVVAAEKSHREALRIAYRTGTITGMLTDGLGLLGGTLIFIIFKIKSPEVLLGFGFGGTLLALFMRVGGGIYTKAADVGADLVGKIEKGIPEDDPRNAAVIADLVGDNVGDCAGMAADIFESYEVTIVSALILALVLVPSNIKWLVFPLLVRAIGVISSIIGTYAVSWWRTQDPFKAMDYSYDLSSVISITSFFFIAKFYVHDLRVFWVTAIGIGLAIAFNKFTSYFTHPEHSPVINLSKTTKTGPATLILNGLSLGFESSVWAIMIIAFTIFLSVVIFRGAGITYILYGVALTGIGMLSHTGNNVSMDVFGPIADNANGIGEMSGASPKVRQVLADLDAAGNTTKAITKGIAIASAVIAAVSLFGAYTEATGLQKIGLSLTDPMVFIGLLIGGAVPFLFSSLAIKAVGRGAGTIIEEVRNQFKIPGVMEGTVKPQYGRVVEIATRSAQKELLPLGLLAILMPILIGFTLQERALGGFLAGIILTGQLLAVFMANSGGAWDNAKKRIEDGFLGGKGTEAHKASVVGDTVGDPLKDTAGPALNPMIKVINLVSLLIAPVIITLRTNSPVIAYIAGGVSFVIVVWAIWKSKTERYQPSQIFEEAVKDQKKPEKIEKK